MGTKSEKAIKALAGARAFPPLMIILYHFSEGHHYSGLQWFDRIAARGYLWVEFFFALSGFILTYAYGSRLAELWRLKGYGAFLRARLIRLYPLHLFTLLLMGAMILGARAFAHWGHYVSIYDTPYHVYFDTRTFLLNLLLVQAWNTAPMLNWNGVSWFVSVEFALCLMFPVYLWLADGRWWRGLALMAAGIGGLLYASYLGGMSNNVNGGQLVLYAVAAAVIGGTSLFGGRGKAAHGVLGGLVMGVVESLPFQMERGEPVGDMAVRLDETGGRR